MCGRLLSAGCRSGGRGVISRWRMISPEEVGHEAYLAIARQDFARLHLLFITDARYVAAVADTRGTAHECPDLDLVTVEASYDATLAACRAFAVALVFESQLVPAVPVGEHDRPVGAVCTEARLLVL